MSGFGFPALIALILIPLVTAVILLVLPKENPGLIKKVAIVGSLAALVYTGLLAIGFASSAEAPVQYFVSYPWIPGFGITFAFGMTGLGLLMVALTAFLTPIVLAFTSTLPTNGASARGAFVWLLLAQFCAFGVFLARDLFLFYVLFEAMLVPIYFLIGRYGGAQRAQAATKFLIYGLFGGLVMLVALIGLYVTARIQLGFGTFDMDVLSSAIDLTGTTAVWIFFGFALAFAIKAPLIPFHTWLPDSAEAAPVGTSVMLIGVLDKVGTFGMLVVLLPIFPVVSTQFAPIFIVLAVAGIIYAALVAIAQTDMRRLLAYASISHFGFIVLGIFAFTEIAMTGAIVYMVAHGLATAGMFLILGELIERRGSANVSDFGGVAKVAPRMAGIFLFSGLATLALPGLAGFVGEIMVLIGAYQRYQVAAVIAALGLVLAAVYVLWMYQRVMGGEPATQVKKFSDLRSARLWVFAPLLVAMIFVGVLPQTVIDPVQPEILQLQNSLGVAPVEPLLAEVSN
jgi:NADH-quinone oxidoreductase subunit M